VGGAPIAGVLIVFIVFFAIGVAIGAIILRAAVSMYNRFAGPTSQVPEPDLGRAMLIVFVTFLVNLLAGFAVGVVFGLGAAGHPDQNTKIIANFASLPVSFLVMAGMLSSMLPTTFGRAALVTICQYVISLLIGLVIAAVAIAVMYSTR
jgi:hypothetical protein